MIIAQSAAVSIGFVLDAIFGDPDFKLHPIRLIGYLISFLEKVMRRIFTKNERFGGAVMAILYAAVYRLRFCFLRTD